MKRDVSFPIQNMKGSVWDTEWMPLTRNLYLWRNIFQKKSIHDDDEERNWSVSNKVSVQFLGINMQEIMEIRDLSPPGSQKSCKFNQQISRMKKN